jgi:CarD family transcriptional regulator
MRTVSSARPLQFQTGETVVYPAHGIGHIAAIEEQEFAGCKLELFVVFFVKDKLTVRVPVGKAAAIGMRKLADPSLVQHALNVLTGRPRINRAMWSRRAAEYQAKVNSGDLIAVAEVVRDLYRAPNQPEASYSERGLYESALGTLTGEISAVNDVTETEALSLIEQSLSKSPRATKQASVADVSESTANDEAA